MTALTISLAPIPNESGYCYGSKLTEHWAKGHFSRMWGLGPRIVSAQLTARNGGGIWKAVDRMPRLTSENLDSLEAVGVFHPSTFGDCYHQLAPKAPRLKHTYNGMFSWWSGGPWEEARKPGIFRGAWYRYDLRSAYRWAATLGLPDVRTFRACVHSDPASVDGLWIANIEMRDDLPNTFRRSGPIVISSEEIRTYGIKAEVLRGVTWTQTLPSTYVEQTLTQLPNAKEAGRAYWGRWISRDPLVCWTPNKRWNMPNSVANFIWGWLIVGRVRSRVWSFAKDAAHIYVDEMLVPHEVATGEALGDWHLKEVYPRGVFVKRTGHFSSLGSDGAFHPAMKTGVAA